MGGGYLNNKKVTPSKDLIIGILVGGIVFGSGVGAATYFSAKDISFTPTNADWNVTNVQDAVDNLYSIAAAGSLKFVDSYAWTNTSANSQPMVDINLTSGKKYLIIADTVEYQGIRPSLSASIISGTGSISVVKSDSQWYAGYGNAYKALLFTVEDITEDSIVRVLNSTTQNLDGNWVTGKIFVFEY